MKSWLLVRVLAGLAAWSATLYAALQIGRLPGAWDHGICGPWGCGPPLQALLACHAFWLALLAPPTVLTAVRMPARAVRRWGAILTAAGIGGLIGVAIWQVFAWLPLVADSGNSYFVQRCLFVLLNEVDVPIVPLTLAGTLFWWVGRRRDTGRVDDHPGP